MSLLTRRHDPDEYDGRDVDDDGDGVLDEGVDGVDGVGDSAEDAEDAEDEDGGWWIFNCSRREVVELLVVTVVIVVVSAALGTGLYQLFGRPDREEWARPGETAPAVAHSHQAQENATPTPTASLSAEEQALREAALSTPKPERPAGMDEQTPEGAAAAATYFLSLYSYVYATGDLSLWQAMSTPDCEFCRLVAERVSTLHESGGWGEPWTDEVVAQSWGYDTSGEILAITVAVTSPERTIHHGSDVQVWKAEQAHVQMQMVWTDTGWSVHGGAAL